MQRAESLQQEMEKDEKLQGVIHDLIYNLTSHIGYSLREGKLLYKGGLIMSRHSRFIPSLIVEFHSSSYDSHFGFFRTYKRLNFILYWEGMKGDVKIFTAEYDICQRMKYKVKSSTGLLQCLPIQTNMWEDLSMDFIEGILKTKRISVVLVIIDRLMKYEYFITL